MSKLPKKELLKILQENKLSKTELFELLRENKHALSLGGVVFDMKYIQAYREFAIKECKHYLSNRCTTADWLKSFDEKFNKPEVV
jgi:hypothetical protein